MEQIKSICTECVNKTKPEFHFKKKFFGYKLKEFDDIGIFRSKISGGFLTNILRVFYVIWVAIAMVYLKLIHWLFPRKGIIYGSHTDTSVVGKITFCNKSDHEVPIHNMKVELWARTWLLQFRKLGGSFSDAEGNFEIRYDLRYARKWRIRRIRFEIHDLSGFKYKDGELIKEYLRLKNIKVPKSDIIGMQYNLGTILLDYWEYDASSVLPKVYYKEYKTAPQHYNKKRINAATWQVIPIELVKIKHLEIIKMDRNDLTVQDIQNDYPENLTICMEKKSPGITRTDEWFGERMMNGMYGSIFDLDPTDSNTKNKYYKVYYIFTGYKKNGEYALPNVEMKFKLKDDGLMLPVEIKLTGPLNKYELNSNPKRVFTPSDGEKWAQAKRVARVVGALVSEVDEHFSGTHANTEQYAVAAYRNIRKNPVSSLLFPHLKEVALINHVAYYILFNQGFIIQASALTSDAAIQRVADTLGTHDWKNWRPLRKISEKHSYAIIANLYWDLLKDYVSEFFAENEDGIKANWYEIFCFSQDLVKHSVSKFLCGYLQKNVFQDNCKSEGAQIQEWYSKEGRMDLSIKRPILNGREKAVSYITTTPQFTNEEDWENLIQACTYAIYQATFGHTWANSNQYNDIGEIRYNCLGLRFGDGRDGVMVPESDVRILPDVSRATQMMFLANLLSRTGYGFITTNEDGDINPKLISKLEEKRKEFADQGFDIDTIQSRTNI